MFNEKDIEELGFKEKCNYHETVLEKYKQLKENDDVDQKVKNLLLMIMDRQWIDHIDNMARFQKGVYLRQYAQIKPIDSKEVSLRKIKVDKNTEFFKNGKPIIWYYKINNDSIEFYNNHGFHPINQKPLKPVSVYMRDKYVVNK